MRILITGGAGFIGSHLCDRLITDGHSVIVLDNLITGSIDNVSHLTDTEMFCFINQNVADYIDLPNPVEAVMHFASPASPSQTAPNGYLQLPILTLKAGALGTLNALGVAKRYGAVFILASTSEVYGDPLVHPQNENYWGNVDPIGPRSVYDEAKRFAEAVTMAYNRTHGVSTRIVRIFNTYGPRMALNDGRVVPNFICQALKGRSLTVYGDGSQTRDFIYVSDVVNVMLKVAKSKIYKQIFNVASQKSLTINKIAKIFGGKIEYLPPRKGEPKYSEANIKKIKTLLKWKPKVSINKGINYLLKQ